MSHPRRIRTWPMAVAALVLALAPAVASADAFLTNCESVTLNGHSYLQYDFTVHNSTPTFFADGIQLVRPFSGDAPDDTCSFVASGSPAGWQSFGTLWEAQTQDQALLAGQTLSGFSIVTTRPCCWQVVLHNFLLIDDPGIGTMCLACPTPARPRTWGAVKAIYR
jgi:hypothetical protein